jgi:hypothetical protein
LTLLVGVATRKGVWIGADSGSVADDFATAIPEPKVWNTGNGWIVACAGDWRALELVRYTVEFPDPPKTSGDAHRTIAIDVVDEIRKAFDARGFECAADDDGCPQWFALLGVRTMSRAPLLFYLESDHPEQHRHVAVGTGEDFALGVLAANVQRAPLERVKHTLKVTREHYGCLRPPYRVESL